MWAGNQGQDAGSEPTVLRQHSLAGAIEFRERLEVGGKPACQVSREQLGGE
jgi:hypothetical protein